MFVFVKKIVLIICLLSILSFVFVSCQTIDIQEDPINLKDTSSKHFQTEDFSFDGEKFHLSLTLEQSLAEGVSEEEFFYAKKLVLEMNERLPNTKSDEWSISAYGYLTYDPSTTQGPFAYAFPITVAGDNFKMQVYFQGGNAGATHEFCANNVCLQAIGTGNVSAMYNLSSPFAVTYSVNSGIGYCSWIALIPLN